jgi:hypothetical protein
VTAKAGDAHLQPPEVGHALQFPAKPTAPLHAGVATRESDDVVLGKEGVEERVAAGVVIPSVLLARIEHERRRSAKGERGIFADVEQGGRIGHIHRAIGHRIERLQPRHQFPSRKLLDDEAAFGQLAYVAAELLRRAVGNIEGLGEA